MHSEAYREAHKASGEESHHHLYHHLLLNYGNWNPSPLARAYTEHIAQCMHTQLSAHMILGI